MVFHVGTNRFLIYDFLYRLSIITLAIRFALSHFLLVFHWYWAYWGSRPWSIRVTRRHRSHRSFDSPWVISYWWSVYVGLYL